MPKTIRLQVDDSLYQIIVKRARSKGFIDHSEYVRDLCIQDSLVDIETLEKFKKLMEILSG
jgi:hypothetical protein